jgi:hypothetical protein
LLAASAIALAATIPASAAPLTPVAAPTEISVPVAHAGDEGAGGAAIVAKLGLAAAATAALAALVRAVGAGRILGWLRAAAPAAKKAADAALQVPVAAVRAVGRAAASPLRFVLLMGGLGLFAFAGLHLFNVEWAGGLVAGGAIVALVWAASIRGARALAALRRRGEKPRER